ADHSSQRGVDGAPAHHVGEETLERGARQASRRGQVLVHEPVRQREAEVHHQHGGHEREARASQGDPVS
ncbi:MAG: hypothetical protein ACK53Y_24035, partial [bacterium]